MMMKSILPPARDITQEMSLDMVRESSVVMGVEPVAPVNDKPLMVDRSKTLGYILIYLHRNMVETIRWSVPKMLLTKKASVVQIRNVAPLPPLGIKLWTGKLMIYALEKSLPLRQYVVKHLHNFFKMDPYAGHAVECRQLISGRTYSALRGAVNEVLPQLFTSDEKAKKVRDEFKTFVVEQSGAAYFPDIKCGMVDFRKTFQFMLNVHSEHMMQRVKPNGDIIVSIKVTADGTPSQGRGYDIVVGAIQILPNNFNEMTEAEEDELNAAAAEQRADIAEGIDLMVRGGSSVVFTDHSSSSFNCVPLFVFLGGENHATCQAAMTDIYLVMKTLGRHTPEDAFTIPGKDVRVFVECLHGADQKMEAELVGGDCCPKKCMCSEKYFFFCKGQIIAM